MLEPSEARKLDLLLSLEYVIDSKSGAFDMFCDYAENALKSRECYKPHYAVTSAYNYLLGKKEPIDYHWGVSYLNELETTNLLPSRSLMILGVKYLYQVEDRRRFLSACLGSDYNGSINSYDNLDSVETHLGQLWCSESDEPMRELLASGLYINSVDDNQSNVGHYLMYERENPWKIIYLYENYGLDIYKVNRMGHRPIDYVLGPIDKEYLLEDYDGESGDDLLEYKLLKKLRDEPITINSWRFESNIEKCYYDTMMSDAEFLELMNSDVHKNHDYYTLALMQKRNIELTPTNSTQVMQMVKKSANFYETIKRHPEYLHMTNEDGNTMAHLCARIHLWEVLGELAKLNPSILSVENTLGLTPMSYIDGNKVATELDKKKYTMHIERIALSRLDSKASGSKFKL